MKSFIAAAFCSHFTTAGAQRPEKSPPSAYRLHVSGQSTISYGQRKPVIFDPVIISIRCLAVPHNDLNIQMTTKYLLWRPSLQSGTKDTANTDTSSAAGRPGQPHVATQTDALARYHLLSGKSQGKWCFPVDVHVNSGRYDSVELQLSVMCAINNFTGNVKAGSVLIAHTEICFRSSWEPQSLLLSCYFPSPPLICSASLYWQLYVKRHKWLKTSAAAKEADNKLIFDLEKRKRKTRVQKTTGSLPSVNFYFTLLTLL